MRKQILLGLALASCWTSLLLGQSPPPPPTPTKPGQEKQDVSSAGKSPTQNTASPSQSPTATINKTTAEPNQADKSGEPTKRGQVASSKWNWGAINTGFVTFFTFILTGVGVFQYLSMRRQAEYMRKQSEYMGDGLKETKRAADAAKDSAIATNKAVAQAERATTLTQRAVILLESVAAEPQLGERTYYLQPISLIVFALKNYGATVAHNVNVTGAVMLAGKTFQVKGAQGVTIAPQGSNKWVTNSLGSEVPAADTERITNGEGLMTYHVEVDYRDVFGHHHHYRASGQFIAALSGFVTGSSTSD